MSRKRIAFTDRGLRSGIAAAPPGRWCSGGTEPVVPREGARVAGGHGRDSHRRPRGSRLVPIRLEAASGRDHGLRDAWQRAGDKPPLFRASSIAVGLKIVSLFQSRCRHSVPGRGRSAGLPDRLSRWPHQRARAEDRRATKSRPWRRFSTWRSAASICANGLFEIESRGDDAVRCARPEPEHSGLLYERAGPRLPGRRFRFSRWTSDGRACRRRRWR